jgi:type III secretion protein R
MVRYCGHVLLLLLVAVPAGAQPLDTGRIGSPIVLFLILAAISLAPFLAIMMTSFVKLSIVLALVKSALGAQVPAGQVTNGLAIVLTFFIMAPVAIRMYEVSDIRDPNTGVFAAENLTALFNAVEKGKEPLRAFLLRHAHAADRALFVGLSHRLQQGVRKDQATAVPAAPAALMEQPVASTPPATPPSAERSLRPDEEFRVILPAFVISELKSAFQVGFLVLLPFLVVDVVVANILVAASLTMIQPAYVSLPVKLLLFVAADGWQLIVKGLVLSYA